MAEGVEIRGAEIAASKEVLTEEALNFVAAIHREFNSRREELLAARTERQKKFDAGEKPGFLSETEDIRNGDWQVGPCPPDLQDRRCEITGPVEAKMMINALNSGAKVFMSDFEDSLSPTWENVVQGQLNLQHAIRRTLEFTQDGGKHYKLNKDLATLLVRPRGWHLTEKNVLVDGQPISASMFDFGLYFFHNHKAAKENGTGTYFYLPKLENHLEARLWNDVFNKAQDDLGVPRGTIKVTVLIETVLAALEMEEILYELRDHMAGLNAGRWDYIFSCIKKFRVDKNTTLPDRGQITMTVPFMRAYTELLVKTCHKRGAHAIGGMSAFIPSRRDEEVNRNAIIKVTEDKEREVADGCDGTWVAHPDLVSVATDVFDKVLGESPNQKSKLREEVSIKAEDITNINVPGGTISEDGVRLNISIGLQYLAAWLSGNGAVAIYNLMEDAATAEISRAQLWQWITNGATMDNGKTVTAELYQRIRDNEIESLTEQMSQFDWQTAGKLMDDLILNDEFAEFLTLSAYDHLK